MVKTLIAIGTSPSQIHLIGVALGAHLASYVGKAIPGIGRITGKSRLIIILNSSSGPTLYPIDGTSSETRNYLHQTTFIFYTHDKVLLYLNILVF
jgi:hypothetical protein